MFGVFKSPGPVSKHSHFDLIKMHPKIFFSQRNVDFYNFESEKCKMNEEYPETLLNFGPLKCSWLGQNSFNIIGSLVRKNEFVKCSFISLLQCIIIGSKNKLRPCSPSSRPIYCKFGNFRESLNEVSWIKTSRNDDITDIGTGKLCTNRNF